MRIPDSYDTIFRLTFEDPALADSEVKMRMSFGIVDAAADLVTIDIDAIKAGRAGPDDMGKLRQLVDEFAGALVSWNFDDDDGQPLPTDRETVRRQDYRFVLGLVHAFQSALLRMAEETREAAQVDEAALPMQAG